MGLSKDSTGARAVGGQLVIEKKNPGDLVLALAGNPNVGKSTVFNALTKMHQHTGNWPGKTVTNAQGRCVHKGQGYVLVDLPGCYSLLAHSAEEEVAREFLCSGRADATIVVCDATCLERNLNLVLQILEITPKVVVCVNLLDEARRKQVEVDLPKLSELLGVPVVGAAARGGEGLSELMEKAGEQARAHTARPPLPCPGPESEDEAAARTVYRAEEIARQVVKRGQNGYSNRDRAWDRILTGKLTGFPIMLLLLLGIFWLTITGANYPSALLSTALFSLGDRLRELLTWLGSAPWLTGLLIDGVYRTLSWVVSVMLPPMAIFFPLFTLLEDLGYLPRVAFNLDKCFQCCGACGKQSLTTAMGFGCNAAGVVGCRIIDSPRERLIAMLTNSFVPCNGRLPMLITLITLFFAGAAGGFGGSLLSALMLLGVILLGVGMTLLISKFLSATLLKGVPSSFTLELPPYRRPQVGKVIVRSVFDRTLFVLGRAAAVAAPAGLVIWLLANITVGGSTLLSLCAGFLDPFARLFGLDGVILLAFILGLPANEIVIPLIVMAYTSGGALTELTDLTALRALLVDNGWTWLTALCTLLFGLMHWPCSTTCMTIKKESGSLKWTAIAFLLPTVCGLALCFLVASAARLLGAV